MVQILTRSTSVDKGVAENGDIIEKVAKPVSGDCAAADPLLEDETPEDSDLSGEEEDGEVTESKTDPWDVPELQDNSPAWSSLTTCGKVERVLLGWVLKPIALVGLLYLFVCSLDFLSSAFRLLGGKAAGEAFSSNAVLQNPIAGIMIGVLATVLVQSSSTSTSIVVTMVASGLLNVRPAIPIIMGANIGTSVTNTIVSLAQSNDRDEFRRAFGGATVHDMFNWLSVIILLPMEIATGYLFHLTSAIVDGYNWTTYTGGKKDLLKTITKPFTKLVVQLDKKVIEKIAVGDKSAYNQSLVKEWCEYSKQVVELNVTVLKNTSQTLPDGSTVYQLVDVIESQNITVSVPVKACSFLFHDTGMSDMVVGLILLAVALVTLCSCLVLMVKILNSVFRGKMAHIIKKTINADFPGCFSFLAGYVAMVIGAGMTILVQSSSVFTSAMTPLVGVGVIKLERMYPLTLGSNIGTTTTGLLAALAASGDRLPLALQIALCHLFFNISGILIFYPIPAMRFPIGMAKTMGNTTAKYRWFAVFYVIMMFFVMPGSLFGLSLAGDIPLIVVVAILFSLLIPVVILNVLQSKCPMKLPAVLRNWNFLPCKWMHSLEPFDRLLRKFLGIFMKCCPKCCTEKPTTGTDLPDEVVVYHGNQQLSSSIQLQTITLAAFDDSSLKLDQLDEKIWQNDSSASAYGSNESGYCTRIQTANNSPSPSKCPSKTSL